MYYIVILTLISSIVRQTDWIGGDEVLGPVSDWKTQYYVGDSITAASEGQVSLIATEWDYDNWVRDTVESNSGISGGEQGLMPADIDGNGILDLVAHSANEVVWYKHDGNYNFSKNVIGFTDNGGYNNPCVYPCDIDKDGDVDVLVANDGVGVGWFKQQNLIWVYHSLDNSIGYHRVSAVDVELDGDIDIIAVDDKSNYVNGDIYLFRDTTGNQDFSKELVADLPNGEGWRVYPADFNGDGFPDIYSVLHNTYVFLNDSTGHFIQSFYANYWSGCDFDGAWASDIDMDGDVDLICGQQDYSPNWFYALLNDGMGNNFTPQFLIGTDVGSHTYTDGAMARDIDSDGFPDIVGTRYKVGWFQQNPSNPLTFTLYDIGDIDNSHWLYVASLCDKCRPSMDLLVTNNDAHIVYENQMLKAFAILGHLESSIFQLPSDSAYKLNYFGYEACVPNDIALAFYWRVGVDSIDIVNKPWGSPHYATTVGMPCVADSFSIGARNTHMFQYKAEFRDGDDIAVLYNVWLTYEYDPSGIEEQPGGAVHELPLLRTANGKLALYLPREDKVKLALYDVSGKKVKLLFDGHLVAGTYEFESTEKSGVYFARLCHTKGEKTLKLIKLR